MLGRRKIGDADFRSLGKEERRMDLKATRSGHETLGLGDDGLLKMYRCMLLARRVTNGPGSSTARVKRPS